MATRTKPRSAADPSARARARYFRVLGDPTRLRILEALLEDENTVSELMAMVAAPQSRVSNHLACLKWCGFATSERRGREVVYRVSDPRVRQVLELCWLLSEELRPACLVQAHRSGLDLMEAPPCETPIAPAPAAWRRCW